jgi:hypothetical protein
MLFVQWCLTSSTSPHHSVIASPSFTRVFCPSNYCSAEPQPGPSAEPSDRVLAESVNPRPSQY